MLTAKPISESLLPAPSSKTNSERRLTLLSACLLILIFSLVSSLAGEASTNAVTLSEFKKSADQTDYALSGFTRGENEFKIMHKTVFEIIAIIHPGTGIPFFDDTGLPNEKYDVTLTGKDIAVENCWKPMEKALSDKFHIKIVPRKRNLEIYEIRTKESAPKGLAEVKNDEDLKTFTSKKGWEFENCSMDDLEDELGDVLPLPVYNETGLKGRYNFVLEGGAMVFPDKAISALEKIGLSVQKVKKEKDVLAIEKISSKTP